MDLRFSTNQNMNDSIIETNPFAKKDAAATSKKDLNRSQRFKKDFKLTRAQRPASKR